MTSSRLVREIDRLVTPDEARRYLETPISDHERAQVRELVDWFMRRYPSPSERLNYVRQAYARWRSISGA